MDLAAGRDGNYYFSFCMFFSLCLNTFTMLPRSECLCPPKNSHVVILTPQRWWYWWGLREVHRAWGWSSHRWGQHSYKRPHRAPSTLPLREDTVRSLWSSRGPSPNHTGTLVLDFSLQNAETQISVIYKLPSLRYSFIAAWME